MHIGEVAPDLGNGVIGIDENADRNAERHDDQADAEQGVDLADDLIDGNEGRDEIVDENDDEPEQGGSDNAVMPAVLEERNDQARRTHGKHGTDHNEQHHAEHAHDILHCAAEVNARDLGDGRAFVSLAHHAGEVIVDSAGKDGTEGDPQEHDGSPQSALQRAEDGTEARDIQKLDHKQLPLRQDDIVHAVVDLDSRSLTVVRAEGVFHDLAVDQIAADQQSKTDQEAKHCFSSQFDTWLVFLHRARVPDRALRFSPIIIIFWREKSIGKMYEFASANSPFSTISTKCSVQPAPFVPSFRRKPARSTLRAGLK